MNYEEHLRSEITRIVQEHPANRLLDDSGPYFEDPLVGFAAANNPLFEEYKQIIGPFHLTPDKVLRAELCPAALKAETVISWVLPVAVAVRRSNRRETRLPSHEWAHTRAHGEEFNNNLRRTIVALLEEWGHQAVAPLLSSAFTRVDDGPAGIASSWSERHAAYAAGLGTFSLSDGLITPRGIAHRLGSVVTDLVLPPSTPVAGDHRAYCLVFRGRECTSCIRRCPASAITEHGHDKNICSEYTYTTALSEVGEEYQVSVTGCGLCQTGVPCESRIPPTPSH